MDVQQFPKPEKRWVNPEYLRMVYGEPCLYSAYHPKPFSQPGPPHHVRWASDCGGSQKPHDYLTISVCVKCHDALHSMRGDWFKEITRRIGREEIKAEMIRLMWIWIRRKFKNKITEGFRDLFWAAGGTSDEAIEVLGEWIRSH